MNIEKILEDKISFFLKESFNIEGQKIEIQPTRKEFTGDFTIVLFPFVKQSKSSVEKLGEMMGEYLKKNLSETIKSFNVIKGFLNIELEDSFYIKFLKEIFGNEKFGFAATDKKAPAVMIEYSSPNTNKPLHLGHIRNNLLGFSLSRLIEASGRRVFKTQIINDRGIHICKSMVAWQDFSGGETPQTSGLKGDKLVGKYYVEFDKAFKKEQKELIEKGQSEEDAKKNAPIMQKASDLLLKWEKGDKYTIDLWEKMNNWVYEGFEMTYKKLGVNFDKNYYESQTYLLGKDIIEDGLKHGVFYKKEDGSVWINLTDEGLDEKLVLRADGTAVYITQDIGTAILRFKEFDINSLIYTVGNEQDYHFKVLFLILKKLGYSWADKLYHLSYGMVDLPSGKMKSREGTVVDADDLVEEMYNTAKQTAEELGKLEGLDNQEKEKTYNDIGLGALKYFILKVDPKKRMMFNPKESIDFNGNTGPFIQYTYARICSLKRKFESQVKLDFNNLNISDKEKDILKIVYQFPSVIKTAANQMSPALIANYVYDLVREYNSFYQQSRILNAEDEDIKQFRMLLSDICGTIIRNSMWILGINSPEKM